VNETAGTYTRSFASFNSAPAAGADTVGHPGIDLFENRVYFSNTAADVRYQKSLRLSFDGGASGFVVQRAAGALFGVVGATARGDVSYRYSRVGTVGADYYFTHFDFKKAFGGSDIHSIGLNWALRLSRTWEFAMRIGAARIESKFLQRVTIDPVIREITGQFFGIEVGHRVSLMPDLNGRLAKNFRHALLQFDYQRKVHPGNGIFLTSMQEHAGFEYSYRGIRRWNFGLNASYNRMGALIQNAGQLDAYQAGLGITRQLSRDFHLVMRADMRKFNLGGSTYNRNAVRTTLGFTYSPGERPLSLW
jgi:hypothetical protein